MICGGDTQVLGFTRIMENAHIQNLYQVSVIKLISPDFRICPIAGYMGFNIIKFRIFNIIEKTFREPAVQALALNVVLQVIITMCNIVNLFLYHNL